MRYTLPWSGEPRLVELTEEMPVDFITSRTPAPPEAVERIHRSGRRLWFSMDQVCLGNREFTARFQESLAARLRDLEEAGMDGVLVSSPWLMRFLRKRSPGLRITVSPRAHICTVRQARFWEEEGADELLLPPYVNRDFPLLRELARATRLELSLVADSLCLFGCPIENYCAALSSHAPPDGGSPGASWAREQCGRTRSRSPEELVKCRFIRPEDRERYEKLGIRRLALTSEVSDVERLVKAARAYGEGAWEGNLLDVLESVEAGGLFLDNSRLEGFLDFFLSVDCARTDCGRCGYCREVSSRAVR